MSTTLVAAESLSTADVARAFGVLEIAVSLPASLFALYAQHDPLPLLVSTPCPACDTGVRTFDLESRLFGCLVCEYASDERDA
ncbi:hypothetical protein [Microbacterium sp. 5K110]|jgi:hypothetical protein|uniref:hypothetical protein n=1 Tax=unclassified Microbacterium TaxID=2609290 RepID=UPI0010FE2F8C|nr:hypothetical protein [Microbacterium sp. 5K110]TLF33938.1 hypothetical protein FE256_02135 [Microbacterium sp. 5K110]